jgi:hypothetical protein
MTHEELIFKAADYIFDNAQHAFDLTHDDDFHMFVAVCTSLTLKMHGVCGEDGFGVAAIYEDCTGGRVPEDDIFAWELHCLKAIDWRIPF